jgi:hypothetical protein
MLQAMTHREVTYARVHVVAWAVWAAMLIAAGIRTGGRGPVAVDTPAEYVALAVTAISCFTLVGSAVAARLDVQGMRATLGPISAAAAMSGFMVPCALRRARWRRDPLEAADAPKVE